jgi:dihydrofolate reductase
MGILYVFNMISIDGYFEGLNHELDWHNVDQEFNNFASSQLKEIGQIMFGRRTYEMMASFWPNSSDLEPVTASYMNNLPKVVFSMSLYEVK